MQAGIFILLGLLFTGAIIWAVVVAGRKSRQRREAVLQQVAAKVGGQVTPGSFTKEAGLVFSHGGRAARVEYYSTGGKHPTLYTRLHFELSGAALFPVHIYPEGFFQRVGKALGTQDIQIGDDQFDSAFMIKGGDPDRVRAFLSQDIRQAIFGLRSLVMNDHVDVSLTGTTLRVQKLKWLDSPDLLLRFIELSGKVADGYRTGGDPSRPTGAAGPQANHNCAVCADAIEGSNQHCPVCGAEHHPECWQLNDGCGICGAT